VAEREADIVAAEREVDIVVEEDYVDDAAEDKAEIVPQSRLSSLASIS